jgi:hypothetical protein
MGNYIFIGGPFNHQIHPTDDSYVWQTHEVKAHAIWENSNTDFGPINDFVTHSYHKEEIAFGSVGSRFIYRHSSVSSQQAVLEFFSLTMALVDKYVEVNRV